MFCATLLQACGSSATNTNKPVSLAGKPESAFPFSTQEPDVYQGDIFVTAGGQTDRWFVARKGEKWRLDVFRDDERLVTLIRTDKLYTIDHRKKTVSTAGGDKAAADGQPLTGPASLFFRGKEYREFEELGADRDLIRYKARSGKSDVLISIDRASGLIVRQEFAERDGDGNGLVYEMRNLKLEVDDAVFRIPDGYGKILP